MTDRHADAKAEMQARLDPLIAERAPWLYSGKPHHTLAKRLMMRLLRYPRSIELAAEFRDLPTEEIMRRISALIVRDLRVDGLEKIPATGPALIVANHPTGIADGIVLHAVVSAVRDDLFIYANHDMIRVLPQTEELIAPVEWRMEKRSHAKTKYTMDYTRAALGQGRIGLIFPSGRLAKRHGLKLHERPWMASAVMIARKFGVPIIPMNIRARNSALFYLLEMLDAGAPRPALILGMPVGFIGAAESKDALAADSRGVPYVIVRGRRGGSAMAVAAVNALASEVE